jgi:hypothetical protein
VAGRARRPLTQHSRNQRDLKYRIPARCGHRSRGRITTLSGGPCRLGTLPSPLLTVNVGLAEQCRCEAEALPHSQRERLWLLPRDRVEPHQPEHFVNAAYGYVVRRCEHAQVVLPLLVENILRGLLGLHVFRSIRGFAKGRGTTPALCRTCLAVQRSDPHPQPADGGSTRRWLHVACSSRTSG